MTGHVKRFSQCLKHLFLYQLNLKNNWHNNKKQDHSMKRTEIPNRQPFKMEIYVISAACRHIYSWPPNLLRLYASKGTLDPHSSSFYISHCGVIHSGKGSSYLSSNTSLDLWDLELSVESGGTASWLSLPFEDFSCRESEREGIKFRGKGAQCLK